jgi:hypothetical protein
MWRRGGRSGDPCLEIVAVAAAHSSVLLTPHKVLPSLEDSRPCEDERSGAARSFLLKWCSKILFP